LRFEGLENRSLLSANDLLFESSPALHGAAGDADLDGVFDSADLMQVFQAGKYETLEAADWSTGDWNFDGVFDSQDLVTALQQGNYASAAAAKEVPFKGSSVAFETSVAQFPTLFVDGTGSGNASHLGRFTMSYNFEVDLLTFVGIGTAQFTAANGDQLFTEVIGVGTDPAIDPVSTIVGTHTITGGTGRFEGASGSFTELRLLNTITGESTSDFEGVIVKA
jgi:hypothetical protein